MTDDQNPAPESAGEGAAAATNPPAVPDRQARGPARVWQRQKQRGVVGWSITVVTLGLLAAVGFSIGLSLLFFGVLPWHGAAVGKVTSLDLMKIALSLVAGAGGAVALTVSVLKQRILERDDEGKRATQQLELAHRQAQAELDKTARDEERARQDAYRERYGAAASQLGSDRPAVQLAGVYAMANLADDWEEQRQQCVDVLCGFLRLPPPADETLRAADEKVRTTICATLREHLQPSGAWCNLDFNLSGAYLVDFDVRGAVFSGESTLFDGAIFSGNHSLFNEASFSGGSSSFVGARFSSESTFFVGATFSNRFTSFIAVNFDSQSTVFDHAHFYSRFTSFDETVFSGEATSFDDSVFGGEVTRFYGTEFTSVSTYFRRTEFGSGFTDFTKANFPGRLTNFEAVVFSGELTGFDDAEFVGAREEVFIDVTGLEKRVLDQARFLPEFDVE